MPDTTTIIRKLNDDFRASQPMAGQLFITAGIAGLGREAVKSIIEAVRDFNDFSKNNDPYHEHDFGSLNYGPHRIVWKIDYYDLALEYGSDDPSDPTITKRILTVMLAEEY